MKTDGKLPVSQGYKRVSPLRVGPAPVLSSLATGNSILFPRISVLSVVQALWFSAVDMPSGRSTGELDPKGQAQRQQPHADVL